MFCPDCGKPNRDTAKFCRACGSALLSIAELEGAPPQESPVAATAVMPPQPLPEATPGTPTGELPSQPTQVIPVMPTGEPPSQPTQVIPVMPTGELPSQPARVVPVMSTGGQSPLPQTFATASSVEPRPLPPAWGQPPIPTESSQTPAPPRQSDAWDATPLPVQETEPAGRRLNISTKALLIINIVLAVLVCFTVAAIAAGYTYLF